MKSIWVVCLLFFPLGLVAQIEQYEVLGLKVENQLYPFKVQLLGEHGLALFQETKAGREPGKRNWEITFLDSALHITKKIVLNDAVDYGLYFSAYANDYCYVLFVNQFNPKESMHAVRINLIDFQATNFEISGFVPYMLRYFSVLGETMILAGEEMHKPSVVCYQFGNKRPIILEGLFRRDSELMHIELSTKKDYFTVYMSVPGNNRKKSIVAVSYNSQAEVIRKLTFVPTRKYELLDGLYSETTDGSFVMAGSYSATKMEEANGIFLARISPDGKQTINYYNFTRLRNFFGFLPSKSKERLEEKVRNKTRKGKSFNYSINLAMRRMDTQDGENFFVADCFNQSGFFSSLSYRWDTGLDYTHSIVAGFGDDAKLRWDDALAIFEDSPGFDLQRTYYAKGRQGNGILFNIQDDDIVARKISSTGDEGERIKIPMKLGFINDLLQRDHGIWTIVEPWYAQKYLVFGVIKFNDYSSRDPFFFLLKLGVNPSGILQQ